MCLPADFLDAHERHWHDAELLYQEKRWANADHLYGLAAECGLKRLMAVFGMKSDSSGSPQNSQDKRHVKEVWDRFESYRCAHPQGTGYALPAGNPFQDWNVSDRYACRSHFNQSRTQSHQAAVQTVGGLIKKAQLEGLII
ncbi:MAG: hypothetical protein H7838_00350 [Magnetococcus sp. DMHC-8]